MERDKDAIKLQALQECCMRHGITIVPETENQFAIYTASGHKFVCPGISCESDLLQVRVVILNESEIN